MKTNVFTMTATEVSSFVTKFSDLLRAGQRASLVMDCDNGDARVTLEVFLQPDRHQHHTRADHQTRHRHPPQHVPPEHNEYSNIFEYSNNSQRIYSYS